MKYFILSIALTVISVTAHSQVNPQFSELESFLQEQGIMVSYVQRNKGKGIEKERSASFSITLHANLHEDKEVSILEQHQWDSLDADYNRPYRLALDSIRRMFSALSSTAAESYMYEYHRNQQDSIEYSIAFDKEVVDSASSRKVGNAVIFENMREVGRLHYQTIPHKMESLGVTLWQCPASYWHCYYEDNPFTQEPLQPFDFETFQYLLQPVFEAAVKKKGVKSYPIYWRHDKGYNDELYWKLGEEHEEKATKGLITKVTWSKDSVGEKHYGLTTGIHYFIPKDNEAIALELLHHVDSITFAYVNAHPEQFYFYQRYERYYTGSWGCIVSGLLHRNNQPDYALKLFQDKEGFHIVSTTTLGELWIPVEWQKLKSWINGEKIYFKGMKPKD